MRYRLRTLLTLAAIGPPLLAVAWWWKEAIPPLLVGFLIGATAMVALFSVVVLAIYLIDVVLPWIAKLARRIRS